MTSQEKKTAKMCIPTMFSEKHPFHVVYFTSKSYCHYSLLNLSLLNEILSMNKILHNYFTFHIVQVNTLFIKVYRALKCSILDLTPCYLLAEIDFSVITHFRIFFSRQNQ